jgi:2-polyprenyl-3-methyl-5-hydroxy-6-metoxy-1,4-benzoquinol methylase
MLSDLVQFRAKQGYSGYRPDILKMIPSTVTSIIDFGCGAGGVAAGVKSAFPAAYCVGVELDPDLASKARQHTDTIIELDLNDVTPSNVSKLVEGRFDVVVLADVLEHLLDPKSLLDAVQHLLSPGGVVIVSLPNVRHISLLWHLFVLGHWPQNDRGIFDRTHLHFYARPNILAMLDECGLEVIKEARNVRLIESWSWTNIPGKLFDFWPFRGFLTFQYIHVCMPKLQ